MKPLNLTYRKIGLINATNFDEPQKIVKRDEFEMPLSSIFHWMNMGEYPFLEKKHIGANNIYSRSIVDINYELGRPRNKISLMKSPLRKWEKRNKLIPLTRGVDSVISQEDAILYSYFPLQRGYIYRQSTDSHIKMFSNIVMTLVDELNGISEYLRKNNVIIIGSPDRVDTYETHLSNMKRSDSKLYREIKTLEEYFFYQLIKFIHSDGPLTGLSDYAIDMTTIILTNGANQSVINLGALIRNVKKVDNDFDISPNNHIQELKTIVPTTQKLVTNKIISNVSLLLHSSDDIIPDKIVEPKKVDKVDIEDVITRYKEETGSVDDIPVEDKLRKMGFTPQKTKKTLERIEAAKNIPSPFDKSKKTSDLGERKTKVDPVEFKDIPSVIDKSMLRSTTKQVDRNYIENVMQDDVVRVIHRLNEGGVTVTKHEVERTDNIVSRYDYHSLGLHPIEGNGVSLNFRLPMPDKEGIYINNGVEYSLKKQKKDLPIRKIDETEVHLSSYYPGKLMISVSALKVDSEANQIVDTINKVINIKDSELSAVPIPVYYNDIVVPRIYSILSSEYSRIENKNIVLFLDYKDRDTVEKFIKGKVDDKVGLLVGFVKKDKSPIYVTNDGFFNKSRQNPMGDIFTLLGLEVKNKKRDLVSMRVMGIRIPVGIILSYYLTLAGLLNRLKVEYTLSSKRLKIDNLLTLPLDDGTLYITKATYTDMLLLNGLFKYKKFIKMYTMDDMNDTDTYLPIMDSKGATLSHFKELDHIRNFFIDPMTGDLLKEMGEPDKIIPLMFRAVELLGDHSYEGPTELSAMAIHGHQRVVGTAYRSIVANIRTYRRNSGIGGKRINMSPYEISTAVHGDPTMEVLQSTNPLQLLKQQEAVTYLGSGGRTKETLTTPTRVFSKTDLGVISEGTPDSGDVGVTMYLSTSPDLTDSNGRRNGKGLEEGNLASIQSSSMSVAPAADTDDPTRANFIQVQNEHTIAVSGLEPMYVRTGGEAPIVAKMSGRFASLATGDGTVTKVSKYGMTVDYKKEGKESYKLGLTYGSASDKRYPFTIITHLTKGDKVKKDDPICWNSSFFTLDRLINNTLIYNHHTILRTMYMEGDETYEDSSAISADAAKKQVASIAKLVSKVLEFDQRVTDVIKIGDKVDVSTVIMTIEGGITASSDVYGKEGNSSLKSITSANPKIGHRGTVGNIEVRYHGDKKDMNKTLRALADESDKLFYKKRRAEGKSHNLTMGRVDTEYKINGKVLLPNTMEILFYIHTEDVMGMGDKSVIGNQVKTTIGEYIDYELTTEDGVPIDCKTSTSGVSRRIVNSPYTVGMATTILKAIPDIFRKL